MPLYQIQSEGEYCYVEAKDFKDALDTWHAEMAAQYPFDHTEGWQPESVTHMSDQPVIRRLMTTTGVHLIATERDEQMHKHGYDAARDDKYTESELASAAASLAIDSETLWPWPENEGCNPHLKEKLKIEKLAIAGALLAAEIDRLTRLQAKAKA